MEPLFPKFKIAKPEVIREELDLAPSEESHVLRHIVHVEFIPVRPIEEMPGFFRGINPDIEREDDRL